MKKSILLLLLAMFATGLFAQKDKSAAKLTNAIDSVNYAYGMNFGNTLKRALGSDLNSKIFLKGLNDIFSGTATAISSQEATGIYADYDAKIAQPRIAAAWKDENAAFLEENKKRKEVTTTASGLQYEVLTRGTGTVSPLATDKVEVHYHGTLIDGQVFDSSVKRNKTASFGLNQVIKGWTEGVQYMKEGDKFRFFIPYNLAYGEQARGTIIKGFSTLIFDVELIKIEKAAQAAADHPDHPGHEHEAKAAETVDAKATGLAFLAENKKRSEVTTTASGLQYEVLKKGDSTKSPTATDKVEVHYHGTLIDGTVFDSSVQRGETIAFGLNQVIKGWTEGVQLMHEGDKFRFYIPSDLAYGDRSPGAGIPPGATLIFEVELFKVNP